MAKIVVNGVNYSAPTYGGGIAEGVDGETVELGNSTTGGRLQLKASDGTKWEANTPNGNFRVATSSNGTKIGMEIDKSGRASFPNAISSGIGLQAGGSPEYSYILPPTAYSKTSTSTNDAYNGENYYSATYTTTDPLAQKFFSAYAGQEIKEGTPVGMFDGFYAEPEDTWDYADYVVVLSSSQIKFYYSSSADLEDAENTISISYRKAVSGELAQSIFGRYNRPENADASLLIAGNGTSSSRSNALRLNVLSQLFLGAGGSYNSSGADHAEFIKPWIDGNPENEDRVGYMVTYAYTDEGVFIKKANPEDYIAGITSGNPCVVGNADEAYYWMYDRDDFNRLITEEIQKTDEEGNLIYDKAGLPVMVQVPKISEIYKPSLPYTPRSERPEWDYVGMVGVIPVRDDGTCIPGQFCKCGGNGIATLAEQRGFDTFFVIERISENVVSVEMKGI